MIPRIVHQIWLGEDTPEPPPHMAEVDALVVAHRPDLLALFRSYPYWVQRSDVARYVILHRHGGVYADFHIACAGALEGLVGEDLVLAPTRRFGLFNDLTILLGSTGTARRTGPWCGTCRGARGTDGTHAWSRRSGGTGGRWPRWS